ncbi:MAG: UDP-N-acetylmuramoyl-tripeptide--D-alanyl-D-alanine ligase, partial [Clostridiales bacterium]|nr:UDP-N-acetylmuramoyl-tripeptide--D-alanyl-D-alanine ligase [Clostridiales bacterium]
GMKYTVLSSEFNTLRTEGNLNNEIGLPKTIFGLEGSHEAAVLEMGMNHAGEISLLSRAGAPTVAVITNIGVAHIGNLGSREGILAAKLEILDGMAQDAPLILNGDDDMLSAVGSQTREIIFYGINDPRCSFRAENITSHDDGVRFTAVHGDERADFFVPVPGRHNVYNALAAAAAGSVVGISLTQAALAIKDFAVEGMRQRVSKIGKKTFLEDCYNSNPDSMRAAIDTLVSLRCEGRSIIVMGDMLELGELSENAHADIGRHTVQAGADVLLAFGEYSKAAVKAATEKGIWFASAFDDKHELANTLFDLLGDGDCVLFKGSRGMKIEEIAAELYDKAVSEKNRKD